MLKQEKLKRIIASTLVIIWMLVVFIFSSQDRIQTLSTSGAVIHIIEKTLNNDEIQETNITENETDNNATQEYKYSSQIQRVVRKNAHCILYMIGGVVLSVFFTVFLSKKSRIITCSVLTGILYAISDEIHQMFVEGRTSSILDVLIDTVGVLLGVILFNVILHIFKKKIKT